MDRHEISRDSLSVLYNNFHLAIKFCVLRELSVDRRMYRGCTGLLAANFDRVLLWGSPLAGTGNSLIKKFIGWSKLLQWFGTFRFKFSLAACQRNREQKIRRQRQSLVAFYSTHFESVYLVRWYTITINNVTPIHNTYTHLSATGILEVHSTHCTTPNTTLSRTQYHRENGFFWFIETCQSTEKGLGWKISEKEVALERRCWLRFRTPHGHNVQCFCIGRLE